MLEKLADMLRDRITDTDLEYWADKDKKLQYALKYAISQINSRCSFTPKGEALFPDKYEMNVLEGAVWYLGKIGAEGYNSTSENGVSINWQDVPDWLSSVSGGIRIC